MHTKLYKQPRFIVAIVLIVLLVCLRFGLVIVSPNGLYLDEGDSKKQVASMLEQGTNTTGVALPLMSINPSGGFTTAPYLYPLTIWSSLFGTSDASIRAFSQFITILAIGFMAYGAYVWRGKRYGYITLITGLMLPWSWVSGNLAWDPVMVPFFISIGFVSFSLLAGGRIAASWLHHLLVIILTLAMVLAAYSYPPARVTAPLLLLAAVLYLYAAQKLSPRSILLVILVGAFAVIPLINFMFTPAGVSRSASLSVFRSGFLLGSVSFASNMLGLINPYHLFVSGDQNLRHSAGFQGMLGWTAIIPIGFGAVEFVKRLHQRRAAPTIFYIAIVGIVAGIFGSALTHEGQPHYLRASASWPFFVLLIALGWECVLRMPRFVKYTALSAGLIALILFIVYLAVFYPTASKGYFSSNQSNYPYTDYRSTSLAAVKAN